MMMQNSLRASPQYLVGRDHAGYWIATDVDGFNGGLFRDRASALHYAGLQTLQAPGAIRLIEAPLELRIGSPPRRAAGDPVR